MKISRLRTKKSNLERYDILAEFLISININHFTQNPWCPCMRSAREVWVRIQTLASTGIELLIKIQDKLRLCLEVLFMDVGRGNDVTFGIEGLELGV